MRKSTTKFLRATFRERVKSPTYFSVMEHLRKTFIKAVLASVLFFMAASFCSAQVGGRTDLGLEGCPITSIASSPDASVVIAGCESPLGLHYSTDGGSSWNFADGGEYQSGVVRSVAATSNGLYASTADGILKAPSPTSGNWEPIWSSLSSLGDSQLGSVRIYSLGDFLYVGTGSSVLVVDTATDEASQTVSVPDGETFALLALAPNFAFLITQSGSEPNSRSLYRTSRSSSTGQLGSSWTDLSDNDAFSSNTFFWSVFAHPTTGAVFVGGRELGESISDLMYRSDNNGETFVSTEQTTVSNAMCFSGNTHIMGTRVSTDDGASYQDLSQTEGNSDQNGSGHLEDSACWISPVNSEVALFTTNDGVDRTSNLSASSPSIVSATLGLRGTLVYSVSKSNENGDRAVFGTSGGVAFTDSFTSDSPTFIYPICPGNDCVGRGNVVLDPVDDDYIYYGSGNIRKGTISVSGSSTTVSWEDFANKRSDFLSITVFETTPVLPGKLVVGFARSEGSIDGGLSFFDTSTGDEQEAADLLGEQVNSFIALSSEVMFVGTGWSTDTRDGQTRGIYRTVDGGLSWSRMEDEDLGEDTLISSFAYDSVRDVLYAASSSTDGDATVFSLRKALDSGTDWRTPKSTFQLENGADAFTNFSSLAVDSETGTIYASSASQIFHSIDLGENWKLFFQGVEGEETQELVVGRGDTGSSLRSQVEANASVWATLIQAASSGLFEVRQNTPSGTECRIKLAKSCKGQLEGVTRCRIAVTLKNTESEQNLEQGFRLFRRKRSGQEWLPMGAALSTNERGKKGKQLKVKASIQFQARFNSLFCHTNTARVKVSRVRRSGR